MKQHTHKYERRRLGSFKKSGHEIYKCTIPGCTHYMVDMEYVVGRYSQCWGILPNGDECPNEVEITRYMVFSERRKHPLCEECKQRRKEKRMTEEEKEAAKIQEQKIERLLELLGEEEDATI